MRHFLFTIGSLLAFFAAKAQYDNQDCVNATPLCYGRYEMPYSFQGVGRIDETISYNYNQSQSFCLLNGENNSAWYKLKFNSDGVLVFNIDPYSSVDDYDFAVFQMINLDANGGVLFRYDCSHLGNALPPVVRCSYAARPGDSTGLSISGTGTSAGANGTNFLLPLNVDSGEVFYIMIDNFTVNGPGFSLDFAGTTANMISDDSLYATNGYATIMPDTIKVDMFFNQSFYCGTLSPDFSEFVLVDNSGHTLDVIAVDCDSARKRIVLTALNSNHAVDSVTVYYQDGSDGDILIAQCGSAELTTTPETFKKRNLPGTLDFFYTRNGNTYDFHPLAHPSCNISWYVNGVYQEDDNFSFYYNHNNPGQTFEVCMVADYEYIQDTVCKTFNSVGIEPISSLDAFALYPNPAQHTVNVVLPYGATSVKLFDINGKLVAYFNQENIPGTTVSVPIVGLPQGIYLVEVRNVHGSFVQKLQVVE